MKPIIKIFILIILFLPSVIHAQELDNLRQKLIRVDSDSIQLDSLSIIPNSLIITDSLGNIISPEAYQVDPVSSILILQEDFFSGAQQTEIRISYRVFPYDFSKSYQNKDVDKITPRTEEPYNPFIYQYQQQESDFMKFSNLSKSGSISRGVSFGNSQNVVVNSNLNLQLSGKLSKDIDVVAAITDNTVPIQPEGNTQQIQEFDKVFIQLSIKKNTLVVGDFELTRPKSYFMNFFEKAQGAAFNTEFDISNKDKTKVFGTNRLKFAAALGKGKFARNNIPGIEGNQGPYKLKGSQGESFLIVLAGSEKVYIDGRLLARGETYDYIINYNLGEITFTPNILITKDSRIVVEFEYSDKNYAQALFCVGDEFRNEKLDLRLNFYSKSDLKNQPLQQDLSNQEKRLMSSVGDSLLNAIVWNIDSVGFSSDQVRYKITDSIINSQYYDTIFVYSTNPDSALYQVGFSLVGEGRGNYVLDQNAANGRVYKWIAPVNGIPQGSYAPVKLLVTPKKSQMLTFAGDYKISKNIKISSEIALSNQDLNTFSGLDQDDNIGFAGEIGLHSEKLLGEKTQNSWVMGTGLHYEFDSKDFKPLEPFRPVEFSRDWNIQDISKSEEHLAAFNLGFKNDKVGRIDYEIKSFLIGNNYKGLRNRLNFNLNYRKFTANFQGSLLKSKDTASSSTFIRSIGDISKKFKWITLGLMEDQEYNIFNNLRSDSLSNNSYSYFKWGAFAVNSDSGNNQVMLNYAQRSDRLPSGNELKLANVAEELNFKLNLQRNRNNRFSLTSSYRNLMIKDTVLSSNDPDKTIVGRIEHFLKVKKGVLSSNIFYEIGTGQEEQLEVSYLRVADGEGFYTWIDYNNDGIQQLNEFEVAPFKDQANFIRLFSSTNNFIRSYFNQFSASLFLNPAAVWINEPGVKKFIARLSNQLAYRTEHKSADNNANAVFNPFISDSQIKDSLLLSLSSNFRNTLYYNRSNSKFSLDLNFQNNRNKVLLNSGFETRMVKLRGVNLRWNFYKAFSLLFSYEAGNKSSFSEFFNLSDYDIQSHRLIPKLSYQPGPQVRIELKYNYINKLNTLMADDTRALIHDIGLELSYKLTNKGSFLVQANYLQVRYNENTNTPLAFEMLNGFQPGDNGTWNLSYQQTIARHLQLNLLYNGRKSPGANIVHVGSIQLRAYF
ncbi:MAG: hypothetical protein U9R60_03090 [Bacteroidota bacterium]|nr:hypothetical protein [Bacteroidota bacterium]